MQHGTGAEPSLCGLPRAPQRRISGSAQFHPSLPSPISRARNLDPSVLRKAGICNHDGVEILHPPAPQEVHHVGPLLGPSGVYEVLFAASLHENPISLPNVYEAHRERTRGWRRCATLKLPSEQGATGRREEGQGQQDFALIGDQCAVSSRWRQGQTGLLQALRPAGSTTVTRQ
jgi:hypothetical protein